jgi:hypothetical protein
MRKLEKQDAKTRGTAKSFLGIPAVMSNPPSSVQ